MKIHGKRFAGIRDSPLAMTQSELAKALGISKTRISKIENADVADLRPPNFRKLAKLVGVTPEVLYSRIGANGSHRGNGEEQPSGLRGSPVEVQAVPLFAMGAPAGSPDFRDAIRDGTEEVESGSPGRFVLRVDGDSMEPSYPNGAKVIFDPRLTIESGRNYLVTLIDGRVTFKHVVIDPKKPREVILRPLNFRYPEREIRRDEIVAVALAGSKDPHDGAAGGTFGRAGWMGKSVFCIWVVRPPQSNAF